MSRTTICDYLKCGNKYGLCEYNPKEERIKANKKSVKSQKEKGIFDEEAQRKANKYVKVL